MKNIGIITIHSDTNYGAALQAYALNQKLRILGYKSEIINYIKIPNNPRKYPFPINIAFKLMNYKRAKRYRLFLKDSVSKRSWTSIDEMMKRFDEPYDVLISGSDQVWNPTCGGLVDKINPLYYLAFADKNKYKKIAYASSIGSYRFNEEEKKILTPWFNDYSFLSTREQAGKEHLESFLNKPVPVVLDPTLLLNRDDWSKVMSPVDKMINEQYVLVYYIDEIEECVSYARKIADKNGWKVAMMTNTARRFPGVDINIPFCGPAEFLWLFEHANYICTNSFHGTAFAVNFNKEFVSVIKRNSPHRAQTLLNNVGLPERLLIDICQLDNLLNHHISWAAPNQKLEELRNNSMNYLLNAIEQ